MTDTALIETQEKLDAAVLSPIKGKIVIWYHDTDFALLQDLDPHIQLLALRLGKQFTLHYFSYPKEMPKPPALDANLNEKERKEKDLKDYQNRYNNVLNGLEHAALFVPCISNAFMIQFWKDAERDPRLNQLLTQPGFEIMPVMLRPTQTGETHLKPLMSAHEGYEREVMCQHLAATIEAKLRESPHYTPTQKPLPLSTLFLSSAMKSEDISVSSLSEETDCQQDRKWYRFFTELFS